MKTVKRVGLIATCLLLCAGVMAWCTACSNKARSVIVYASQDQVFAEPILQLFEEQTGIKVKVVYDSEAVKTVGLANRLLNEKDRPQCDVFWSNEEFRTRQLAARGVLDNEKAITRIGYRSRRIVYNTNLINKALLPESFIALTNSTWKGKLAIAYPLFGTTATHFLYLRQVWGQQGFEAWCRELIKNQPRIVDGNSTVVNLVGRGECVIGCTDSDDIDAGIREGLPIARVPGLAVDALLIPNTIATIKGCPHPAEAGMMRRFLESPVTTSALVRCGALEAPDLSQAPSSYFRTNAVPWEGMLQNLDPTTAFLKEVFLR